MSSEPLASTAPIPPIPPVIRAAWVDRPAEEAFQVFTQEIGAWWPLPTHGLFGDRSGSVHFRDGKLIEGVTNDRVASAPLPSRERSLVIALAMGEKKLPGILAAVTRRLVNGLITDEQTAEALLAAS